VISLSSSVSGAARTALYTIRPGALRAAYTEPGAAWKACGSPASGCALLVKVVPPFRSVKAAAALAG